MKVKGLIEFFKKRVNLDNEIVKMKISIKSQDGTIMNLDVFENKRKGKK